MNLSKLLPYLISGFIVAVGLFFIAAGYIGPGFLDLKAPGSYYLLGLSVFFIMAGALTSYLTHRGALKRIGMTTEDVRQESISKLKDKQLLAQVALGDDSEEIRETAAQRLKDIED